MELGARPNDVVDQSVMYTVRHVFKDIHPY